jgi:DNA-binding response OmpR family regulator
MPTLLIVEDDPYFREALSDMAEDGNFKASGAANGQQAQQMMLAEPYDVVLSDLQMPIMNGLDLLRWAKQQKLNSPIVLMTGFSTLLETKTALELGAREFILKPFKQTELIEVLNRAMTHTTTQPRSNIDIGGQYHALMIDDLIRKPRADYDLYVSFTKSHYLKIAHKGDTLETARLLQYKQNGIEHLFALKKDVARHLHGVN